MAMAMQGYTEVERRSDQAYEPPPEPVSTVSGIRAIQRGDTVTFDDRDGRNISGAVLRVNQRTATIGTGDGGAWRAPFHVLRHALDI